MPATNTSLGIGIRLDCGTLGERNFENIDGTVQYACNHEGLEFQGTTYSAGDSLPFDVGGTSYSASALQDLQLYWNQGWLLPIV